MTTEQEIKDAARHDRSGSTRRLGGAVLPMDEAATLDQRIATKTTATGPSSRLLLVRKVSSGPVTTDVTLATAAATTNTTTTATTRDASASQLALAASTAAAASQSEPSSIEFDTTAEKRVRSSHTNVVAAKATAAPLASKQECNDPDVSVQAKVNVATRKGDFLLMTESDHATGDAKHNLSRLDARIATKNASTVRFLQDTEDISLTQKQTGGTMHGGTQISPLRDQQRDREPSSAKGAVGSTPSVRPPPLPRHTNVDYGEFGGSTEQGLAVAFAVEQASQNPFIPAAIEYDPDAKPPMFQNRRFRLYSFLAVVAVLVGSVSVAVGITVAGKKARYHVAEREMAGIREAVEKVVGAEKLGDSTSPHSKALDWIQYHDPLQLIPSNETFVQRYVLALFYYSTSIKHEWSAGCAPAVEGETDTCVYQRLVDVSEDGYSNVESVPWVRWLSGTSECNWAGILCSDEQHVRVIEMSGANMTGSIPDELNQLNFLQALTVKYNALDGPLPEKLVKLRNVVDLDLFGNQFTGTIADSFFTSPILQRLNLSLNRLNGTISTSIGQMIDAKALFLGFNELTGTLPTEIGRLPGLVSLWFQRNQLTGTIPTEIGNIRNLQDLILNGNKLSGSLPTEIAQVVGLVDFKVSDNRLRGHIPSALYNLLFLHSLDLFKNQLTGTISPAIGNMTYLNSFRLQFNDFTGTLPTILGSLPRLEHLQVFGNAFNGSMPLELCPAERAALNRTVMSKLIADCAPGEDGFPPAIECKCCTACCTIEKCVRVP